MAKEKTQNNAFTSLGWKKRHEIYMDVSGKKEAKEIRKKYNKNVKEKNTYITNRSQKEKKMTRKEALKYVNGDAKMPRHILHHNSIMFSIIAMFSNIKTNIATFFVNLFSKRTVPIQNVQPIPSRGYQNEGFNAIPKFKNEQNESIEMDEANTLFEPEKTEEPVLRPLLAMENEVDIKKEFILWLNKNKINELAPQDVVFDFMKSAIIEGVVANDKQISELLTFAYENECKYDSNKNTVEMYFAVKAENKVAAIDINLKGNISYPETFEYKGQQQKNPLFGNQLKQLPIKIKSMSKELEHSPNIFEKLTNKGHFSRDSLMQVKEYADIHQLQKFIPVIDVVENAMVDQNAKYLLNKFITEAAYILPQKTPEEIFDLAFMKPSQTMTKMCNPAQYDVVFNQTINSIIKGYSVQEAISLSESFLKNGDEGKELISKDARDMLIKEADELGKHGYNGKEIAYILQSINRPKDEYVTMLNIALINRQIRQGDSKQDIMTTERMVEFDTDAIAKSINDEFEQYDAKEMERDIIDNLGYDTKTKIYLAKVPEEVMADVIDKVHEDAAHVLSEVIELSKIHDNIDFENDINLQPNVNEPEYVIEQSSIAEDPIR